MPALAHPEVLAADWVPPALVDRARELDALQHWLGDPLPSHGAPWAAAVRGPPGAGTSALARLAALRLIQSYRRERPGATPPVLVPARVRWCRGSRGVAAQLLRRLDEGFGGPGFSVVEIVAGLLRRLLRSAQPAVVLLDDIGPDAPDLAPILRGLLHPIRFLPEGIDAAPPIWILAAGTLDRPEIARAWAKVGFPMAQAVQLEPMGERTLRAVLRDRAVRALGREPPEPWLEGWVSDALRRELGAARAMDLLRRQLLGESAVRLGTVFAPSGAPASVRVEPRILRAFAELPNDPVVDLSALRDREADLAQAEGDRPLPATTLWRRLVHLEAAGLVKREVRTGGPGGTRSRLAVLRPVSEWPVPPGWDRTRPGAGGGSAPPVGGPGYSRPPASLARPSVGPAAGRPFPRVPGS